MLGDADCQAAPAPASGYKCNQVKQQLQSLLLWPLGPGHVFFFESIITVPGGQDPWQRRRSGRAGPAPPRIQRVCPPFPVLRAQPRQPQDITKKHNYLNRQCSD